MSYRNFGYISYQIRILMYRCVYNILMYILMYPKRILHRALLHSYLFASQHFNNAFQLR